MFLCLTFCSRAFVSNLLYLPHSVTDVSSAYVSCASCVLWCSSLHLHVAYCIYVAAIPRILRSDARSGPNVACPLPCAHWAEPCTRWAGVDCTRRHATCYVNLASDIARSYRGGISLLVVERCVCRLRFGDGEICCYMSCCLTSLLSAWPFSGWP